MPLKVCLFYSSVFGPFASPLCCHFALSDLVNVCHSGSVVRRNAFFKAKVVSTSDHGNTIYDIWQYVPLTLLVRVPEANVTFVLFIGVWRWHLVPEGVESAPQFGRVVRSLQPFGKRALLSLHQ